MMSSTTTQMPISPVAAAASITWRRNRDYLVRLTEDVPDAAMAAQPISGVTMNHPAWIISHLSVYVPIVEALAAGAVFSDPIDHPFGQKSEVVNDPSAYAPKETLLNTYLVAHDKSATALRTAHPDTLAKPNPLARWRETSPTAGDMLIALAVKHESMHLGQLSAWRRAMRFSRVSM